MRRQLVMVLAGCVLVSGNLLGFGSEEETIRVIKRGISPLHASSGYLGVSIRDIDAGDVKALSLPAERGAYIEKVEGESPAEEAGLTEADVVLQYAGESVFSVRQFQRLVRETPPGREVQLEVWRAGSSTSVSAKIGDRFGQYHQLDPELGIDIEERILPHSEVAPPMLHFGERGFNIAPGRPRLGVQVAPLTEQMADFLGIPGRNGVLILETLPSTPAAVADLRAGDVILSVNGREVRGPRELIRHLTEGENNIEIARDKRVESVSVNLGESKSRSEDALEL